MKYERLDLLRALRSILAHQLALVEIAIAAETATTAFQALNERLVDMLDDMCQVNAACEMTMADLRELPAAPEPGPGLN